MTTYLGIDLAWAERARTGLAALDGTGRLVASDSVVTNDLIAAFVARHAPGPVVAAIDAPLVVPNADGRRDCEAELNREFGRYNAGAHPTNRSRRWFNPPRGALLSERFGWSMDPAVRPEGGTSVAIEVYPHPAMVSLFDLATVIPYKDKRGRTTTSRKAAFDALLEAMERVCEEPLRLAASPRWAEIRAAVVAAQRPIDLRVVEDEIDAIFCAYLAWLWGQGDPQMRVLGDIERGYIVVPGSPRVAPARTTAVRVRPAAAVPGTAVVADLVTAFRAAVPSLTSEEAARLAQLAAIRGAR
jgi:predicted RNase H-like nuclease